MHSGYHLFSIPIYSTSKREFDKKLNRYLSLKDKQLPDCTETERAQIKADLFAHFRPRNIWIYNQIIGYIRVFLDHPDIFFEVYMPLQRERYRLFSNRKSYCDNWHANGLHFNIVDKTNDLIRNEIREWLIDISRREKIKNRYIDITVFENIAKYIDFRTLINEVHEGGCFWKKCVSSPLN